MPSSAATGADREAIRTVLADRSFARVAHADILEILQRHGSLSYAMDTACAYAEAARQSIADLPESDYKRALLWVPRLRYQPGSISAGPLTINGRRHSLRPTRPRLLHPLHPPL